VSGRIGVTKANAMAIAQFFKKDPHTWLQGIPFAVAGGGKALARGIQEKKRAGTLSSPPRGRAATATQLAQRFSSPARPGPSDASTRKVTPSQIDREHLRLEFPRLSDAEASSLWNYLQDMRSGRARAPAGKLQKDAARLPDHVTCPTPTDMSPSTGSSSAANTLLDPWTTVSRHRLKPRTYFGGFPKPSTFTHS
jgi:hypothetical protein